MWTKQKQEIEYKKYLLARINFLLKNKLLFNNLWKIANFRGFFKIKNPNPIFKITFLKYDDTLNLEHLLNICQKEFYKYFIKYI